MRNMYEAYNAATYKTCSTMPLGRQKGGWPLSCKPFDRRNRRRKTAAPWVGFSNRFNKTFLRIGFDPAYLQHGYYNPCCSKGNCSPCNLARAGSSARKSSSALREFMRAWGVTTAVELVAWIVRNGRNMASETLLPRLFERVQMWELTIVGEPRRVVAL